MVRAIPLFILIKSGVNPWVVSSPAFFLKSGVTWGAREEMIQFISFFFAAVFYVYILYSPKSDRYYVGHTNDIDRRLEEHNHPREAFKYTSKHLPWKWGTLY